MFKPPLVHYIKCLVQPAVLVLHILFINQHRVALVRPLPRIPYGTDRVNFNSAEITGLTQKHQSFLKTKKNQPNNIIHNKTDCSRLENNKFLLTSSGGMKNQSSEKISGPIST